MEEAYKVFVHVLGPNGLPVAQQDNEPLNGTYPTPRWQPGERVSCIGCHEPRNMAPPVMRRPVAEVDPITPPVGPMQSGSPG